jgi:hypothetical protein
MLSVSSLVTTGDARFLWCPTLGNSGALKSSLCSFYVALFFDALIFFITRDFRWWSLYSPSTLCPFSLVVFTDVHQTIPMLPYTLVLLNLFTSLHPSFFYLLSWTSFKSSRVFNVASNVLLEVLIIPIFVLPKSKRTLHSLNYS